MIDVDVITFFVGCNGGVLSVFIYSFMEALIHILEVCVYIQVMYSWLQKMSLGSPLSLPVLFIKLNGLFFKLSLLYNKT